MLEHQLRDEIQNIQNTLSEEQRRNNEQTKPKPLSKRRKKLLSIICMDSETLIEQPLCPICNEDYCEKESLMKLPCNHIFHGLCVMPWLELKDRYILNVCESSIFLCINAHTCLCTFV